MNRAGRLVLPLALLFLAGCPHPPVKSRATVNAAELGNDPAVLDAKAAEWEAKGDAVSLENALAIRAHRADLTPKDYDAQVNAAKAAAEAAEAASKGVPGDPNPPKNGQNDEAKRLRRQIADEGEKYADQAISLDDKRAPGHYWKAILIGLDASTRTLGAVDLLPKMMEEAKKAAALDEKYDHGGPLRIWGALLIRAPSWPSSIGDVDEGAQKLKRAVEVAPEYPQNHLFYCEALKKNDQPDAAKAECQKVLDAPADPAWEKKLPDWKAEAAQLMK